MKTKYLFLVIITLISTNIFSQNCKDYKKNREKYEAEKVAYITKQLNLSVKESQEFWPLYNEYQNKKDDIFISLRKIHKNIVKDFDNISDQDAEKALNQISDLKVQQAELSKEYEKKFLKVLPPKKVLLLYKAERDFKKTLLKELKKAH